MSVQDTTDQNYWSKLLDNAFGAEQSSEPAKEPAAQEEISAEEPVICPKLPVTDTPTPRKRHLWPVIAAAAAILILLATILLFPRKTVPPELQLCKDALAQWQGYENYHIIEDRENFEGMSLRPYAVEYFRHGDNIMQLSYSFNAGLSSSTLSMMQGYMRKDGQTYEYVPVTFGDLIDHDGMAFQWKPVVLYGGNLTDPWPITFQWDDAKILSHNTRYYESGAVESVMITIEEDKANQDNSPFNVVFRFTETGELTAVSVQQIATTNHYFTGIYISTFRLEDTDSEQIEERFKVNIIATSSG